MKLYYKPGACSLASHIVLREAGAAFTLEKVDTAQGVTESGEAYREISPNGYVPALRIDGAILTEGPAILQHLAERFPSTGLLPAAATLARARVIGFVNFAGSELHKAFSPFFSGALTPENRTAALEKLAAKLRYVEETLSDGREFIAEDAFTIADAYLLVVVSWTAFIDVDLEAWPHIAAYAKRLGERPSVIAARQAEGIAG